MKRCIFIHEDIHGFFDLTCKLDGDYLIYRDIEGIEREMARHDLGMLLTVEKDLAERLWEYRKLKEQFAFFNILLVQESYVELSENEVIDEVLFAGGKWNKSIENIFAINHYNRRQAMSKEKELFRMDGFDLFRDNGMVLPGRTDINHFKSIVEHLYSNFKPEHIDKMCICLTGRKNRICRPFHCEPAEKPMKCNVNHYIRPIILNFNEQDYHIGWTRVTPISNNQIDNEIAANCAKTVSMIASAWVSEAYSRIFKFFINSVERGEAYEQEKLKGYIMDSIDYGVVAIDNDTCINYMNENARKFFNIAKEGIMGKKFVDAIERGKRKGRELLIYDTLVSGTSYGDVIREVFIDGGYKRALFDTAQVRNDKNEPIGAVLTFKDITRRQEEEERREHWEKLLLAGELAATISHEIKNPLSIISGLMQLFRDKDGLGADDIKKYADMGLKEINRIQALLGEYLSTVKEGSSEQEVIDVVNVLSEFVVLLRLSMDASKVNFRLQANSTVPRIKVDVSQLKQIILNLVQNAVHAVGEEGLILMKITYNVDTDRVLIQVEDNGTGISDDCIDKIFKPFYTTKKNGTGLGLPLCRRMAIENGGGIEVKSKLGLGSKFTVWFPAYR